MSSLLTTLIFGENITIGSILSVIHYIVVKVENFHQRIMICRKTENLFGWDKVNVPQRWFPISGENMAICWSGWFRRCWSFKFWQWVFVGDFDNFVISDCLYNSFQQEIDLFSFAMEALSWKRWWKEDPQSLRQKRPTAKNYQFMSGHNFICSQIGGVQKQTFYSKTNLVRTGWPRRFALVWATPRVKVDVREDRFYYCS